MAFGTCTFVGRAAAAAAAATSPPPRASRRSCRHHRTARRAGMVTRAAADPDSERYEVTTPLFYVNAEPHLGSAYTTIASDALVRAQRLQGSSPVFVTGVDEHGEKIKLAADRAGVQPQEHCDRISVRFVELFELLDVQYDRFIRTTSARHERIVLEFMNRVWDNGDIYKATYEGLYCTGCEEYKDMKELLDKDTCPVHRKRCERRREENYFFALSKYQKQLEDFHAQNPGFVQPERARNEVLGWIKSGLRDFSVSRAKNPWGIAVPRDASQTIYVWFDALLGYVSALLEEDDEATLDTALSRGWPAQVHVIGKDILRFHAVYWPAMLMAAGVSPPRQVFAHGFLTKDGLKMGKSLGNTLNPFELAQRCGTDAVRYYFLRAIEFGQDGDFTEERFVKVVNADLANNVGNLLNRCLNLMRKHSGLELQVGAGEVTTALREQSAAAVRDAAAAYAALRFADACVAVRDFVTAANVFIDGEAPWKLFKSEDAADAARAAQCMCVCLESVRVAAVALKPVTPALSRRIYGALGLGDEEWLRLRWEDAEWGRLEEGHKFPKPTPVFPRLESAAQTASSSR